MHVYSHDSTKSYLNSIEYSIRVQWPKAVDMQYYETARMTSDLTCLETEKNTKYIKKPCFVVKPE